MSGTGKWRCLATALLLAGCAATPEREQTASTPNRQCFFTSSARSFAVVDNRTVNVRAGSDVFRIDLFSQCPDLTFASRVSLRASTGSSVCAGSGMGVTLVHRTATRQRRCSVRSVTPLTADQIQALPNRERPM